MHRRKYLICTLLLLLTVNFALFSKDYKGAEIRTMETFLYGRFEVNMKSAQGSGIVSSFFTFYDQPDFVTNWNEIDIEILGRYENEIQFNGIVGKHEMHEHRHKLEFNPHKEFHIYAFEWTPEYIAWYIDGKEAYRQTGEHVAIMSNPQKLMMNFWATEFEDWSGKFTGTGLPLKAEYDFVKYSSYDINTKEFKPEWTDNFDKLDLTRWALATHTFEGNKVDFVEENAVVKNGKLTLIITKALFEEKEVKNDKSEEGKGEIKSVKASKNNTSVTVSFNGDTYIAQTKKKYFAINGLEIKNVRLHSDLRTLTIYTSSMEEGKEYELKYSPQGAKEQNVKFQYYDK